jgi:hypothetical protein
MNFHVAGGVQQDTIVRRIAATSGTPDLVMVVPVTEYSELLATDGTDAVLLLPLVQQLSPSPEIRCHLHA